MPFFTCFTHCLTFFVLCVVLIHATLGTPSTPHLASKRIMIDQSESKSFIGKFVKSGKAGNTTTDQGFLPKVNCSTDLGFVPGVERLRSPQRMFGFLLHDHDTRECVLLLHNVHHSPHTRSSRQQISDLKCLRTIQ